MKVLVTGGLGYIGAHVVDELVNRGHSVDVVDGSSDHVNFDFVHQRVGRLLNRAVQSGLGELCSEYDAIVHLAAFISVELSTREPHTYWHNNLTSLMELEQLRTPHLIFASTGTAFNPTSPYARTKVACESYITDVAAATPRWFDGHTIFRFYNVSGLAPGIRPTGQPTHLIRICAEAARGKRGDVKVFGTDYATKDGTAVRDYVHVQDIAASIANAVEVGPVNTPFECLGTGMGYSVLEVIHEMKHVTNTSFPVVITDRRAGDDDIMICHARSLYPHAAITRTLSDMCLSAFRNV